MTCAWRASMHPSSKARGVEHTGVFERRATKLMGMQQRPNAKVISTRLLSLDHYRRRSLTSVASHGAISLHAPSNGAETPSQAINGEFVLDRAFLAG
jgi:hypothetical protein